MKKLNVNLISILPFFLLLHLTPVTSTHIDHCPFTHQFADKLAYEFHEDEATTVHYPHGNCVPIQINMVLRHGHRYPSLGPTDSYKSMTDAVQKINKNAKVISSRFNITLPWVLPFGQAQASRLTSVGEWNLYRLGLRIKKRFAKLFQTPYSPTTFKFRSTCKMRTIQSTHAFARGLLGRLKPWQHLNINTPDCNHDPILLFNRMCKKLNRKMSGKQRQVWLSEYYKFKNGVEMNAMVQRFNEKVGLKMPVSLKSDTYNHHHSHHHQNFFTRDDIEDIFYACALDISLHHRSGLNNSICSLLDVKSIDILNYLYDLQYFYRYSAGHPLNYKIACPLLVDVYNSMLKAAINNRTLTSGQRGIFRTGHMETLLPFLALLDVYGRDGSVLKADNYRTMNHRTFRTACITPFSGNLYFVLYRCSGGRLKVQLYVNERLHRLPCCSSTNDCDLDAFLEYYKSIVYNCDLKSLCEK